MRENPFATVITPGDGAPWVSHLPVLVEESSDGSWWLRSHLARANPHWQALAERESLFIFHGPHTYITPSWYKNPLNVPTWSYAVVHAHAQARMIDDPGRLRELLQATVDEFESKEPKPWRMDIPSDYEEGLMRGIIGFEARVLRIEAKFKLSQNRSAEDRAGAMKGLAGRTDEMSRRVLGLMKP